MSVSADRQPADPQELRDSPTLLNILACKPGETDLRQYRACLTSLSEEAFSGDLEAVSLFLSTLKSTLGSCPLQTSEEFQQFTETLSEVCRYGHTLFEAQAQGEPGTVGETAQVHFAALKKGVSRLHARYEEASVGQQDGNSFESVPIAILRSIRHCVSLMDIAFFSQRWVDWAGTETFSLISSEFRALLKDDIVPLVSLACKSPCPGAEDTDEALYQQLHHILCDLLSQGSKCAHVIDGTNKDLSAKEFRSFGTLNALWASLIKITVGLPPAMGRALTQCKHASDGCDLHFLSALIDELSANMAFAFGKLLDSPDTNQLQVFRFWLQALMKILSTFPTTVLLSPRKLVKLGCQMYDPIAGTRGATGTLDQGISAAIENAAKRYVSCLLDVTESQDGMEFFQIVTVELAEPSNWHPPILKARTLFGMDLLDKIPSLHGSTWPIIISRFLPWLIAAFQQCPDLMDDTQMQLRLRAGVATCVCCLSRVAPEEQADVSLELLFLLLRMALDLHPHTQHLLLHLLMTLEPQILGDFCRILVKIGISFAAVALIDSNHQVDILHDSIAHLAGQVLRMAPKDIVDTVSLQILKECTQPDKPPFIFVGLRTAARLLIPVFEADTPPHVQQELLRHLNSSIKSAREFHETGCQHQYLYLSLLCIEELSRALGSSQVATEYQEQLGILLENILEADTAPPCVKGTCLHIAALFEDTKALHRISKFLPVAANLAEAATPCAAIAQRSSKVSDNPAELFQRLFQATHWALRFETCQSLVQYAKLPETGNFRTLIPAALLQKSEAGESPLVVQLQQHIQRKCTQSKLLSQRLTDYEAQEAILLGEASKDLPLTICRIIARQSTGNTQRQGMKEEADNVGEVFTATGDALEQLSRLVEKHGAQLLKDPRFAEVHQALSQLLAKVQNLTSPAAGARKRPLVSNPGTCAALEERVGGTEVQLSQ